MLSRFRIEVEGMDSAADAVDALDKYEEALHQVEARRLQVPGSYEALDLEWEKPSAERVGFFNSELGREVTDEVIEKDKDNPGYKGRRVVQLTHDDRVGGMGRGQDPEGPEFKGSLARRSQP